MKLTNELREAIENYKNGNEDAFSTIYEESKGYIYVCIANTLNSDYKNEDVIQDIMQDAYLDISKNLIKLDNTEDFLSWAATIAKRRTYDYLKKQDKYVLLGEDETFENLSDDDNMLPEEVVLSKEKQEKVREVVNTELTEDEKNCVVGFYYNDMKQKDIAKELDMPENTVKSNIFRAKSKMKKALSGVFVVALAACLLIFALNTPAVKQALRRLFEKTNNNEVETKVDIEQPSKTEELGTEIIPEGCFYYSAKTNERYQAGEKFFATLSIGDKLYTTDYMYEYIGDGWSVKARDTSKTEYEKIMPTIAGEPLLSMAGTFADCNYLTKTPYIPEGVTNLDGTFELCTSLKTVTNLPNSCVELKRTFAGCVSLVTAPVIPDTVTNMYDTFQGCGLVTAPVIPESVTNMSGTFSGCISLVAAPIIPDKVTDMQSTFSNCSSLVTAPVIPDTVTNMSATFAVCSSLVEAPAIPDSVTDMTRTFMGCSSLIEAPVIPASVTEMFGTFSECTSLTGDIVINTTPRDCGSCFEGVKLLKQNIKISGSSNNLEELKSTAEIEIVIPEVIEFYDASENKTTVYDGDFVLDDSYLSECPDLENDGDKIITDDYEYTYVVYGEFYAYFMWKVKVKDTTKEKYEEIISTIGNIDLSGTFAGCTNMKEAPKLNGTIIKLDRTFEGCTSLLKTPDIPERVMSLERTFEGCTSLESASIIPEDVRCLYRTFSGCTNLTGTVEINAKAIVYNECFYGIDFSRQNLTLQGITDKLADIKLTTDKIGANKNIVEYGDVIKVSCREKYSGYSPTGVYGEWIDVEDREFIVHVYNSNFNAEYMHSEYRAYTYEWRNLESAIGKKVGEAFETLYAGGDMAVSTEYTILEIIKSE